MLPRTWIFVGTFVYASATAGLTSSATGTAKAQPPAGAAQALRELEQACAHEGGELWGASLCGPMLVVDPATRAVTANAADAGGLLRRAGALWVGVLPEDVGLANTAMEWSGSTWSMVLLPLPDEPQARRALMLHEAWHRVQDNLGLPARDCDNSHLEETQARIWMRLEWRALARALERQEDQRLTSLADALLFRWRRQQLFPGSSRQEACLELHEGLAEYTGLAAAYGPSAAAVIAHKLADADRSEHLARSFAYLAGPAYAVLLDDLSPGWRRRLTLDSDLGTLAAQALPAWSPELCQIEDSAAAYGYSEVSTDEEQAGIERERVQAQLRASMVDSPGLVLPLEAIKMQFDPNMVVGLAPHGTVYLTITVRDSWGILEADEGALIASDYSSVAVPGKAIAVEGIEVRGDTWRLDLAEGWRLLTPDQGPATVARVPAPSEPESGASR
jgi:hypothetical protein